MPSISLTSQEHDASILEGSHPHNLVIPHLLPLLTGLHEEAVFHNIRTLPTDFTKIQKFILFHLYLILGNNCLSFKQDKSLRIMNAKLDTMKLTEPYNPRRKSQSSYALAKEKHLIASIPWSRVRKFLACPHHRWNKRLELHNFLRQRKEYLILTNRSVCLSFCKLIQFNSV